MNALLLILLAISGVAYYSWSRKDREQNNEDSLLRFDFATWKSREVGRVKS